MKSAANACVVMHMASVFAGMCIEQFRF